MLAVLLASVPFLILWERRFLGFMQDRLGPNRVGPKGLLQTIADGIKLFFKEEIRPYSIDPLIYWLAPMIALMPAFVALATIPWGPTIPIRAGAPFSYLTPVANVDIGILWVLAMSSLGVYGIVLAGWSSNNKYSLLGGLRSSAQIISYELPATLALGTIILTVGSLQLPMIVDAQTKPWLGAVPWISNWFAITPFGFVAFIVYAICMVAETNRAPFDLPEAESELVAGFHTEYSSMKFASFYMGEYANMIVLSMLAVTVFFGGFSFILPVNLSTIASWLTLHGVGWLARPVNFVGGPYLAWIWFIGKVFLMFSAYIWIRATLPRLRYDQLMALSWQGLLPLTLILLGLVMTWLTFGWQIAIIPAVLIIAVAAIASIRYRKSPKSTARTLTMYKEAEPLV